MADIPVIDDLTAREVINLCHLIAEDVLGDRWSLAHTHAHLLADIIDGRGHVQHWRIRVAVAAHDRQWFAETVDAPGSSQALACMTAAASVRIEHHLADDVPVSTTILGPVEISRPGGPIHVQ